MQRGTVLPDMRGDGERSQIRSPDARDVLRRARDRAQEAYADADVIQVFFYLH